MYFPCGGISLPAALALVVVSSFLVLVQDAGKVLVFELAEPRVLVVDDFVEAGVQDVLGLVHNLGLGGFGGVDELVAAEVTELVLLGEQSEVPVEALGALEEVRRYEERGMTN